jgi:hypothetical protein
VLVGGPFRKQLNVFPDESVVGVEQMRHVQVDAEARFVVDVIIAIATDVLSLSKTSTLWYISVANRSLEMGGWVGAHLCGLMGGFKCWFH